MAQSVDDKTGLHAVSCEKDCIAVEKVLGHSRLGDIALNRLVTDGLLSFPSHSFRDRNLR